MKVLFAGPSLHEHKSDFTDISMRGPAKLGDITVAVYEGASTIGLVDGYFGSVASTWHKEILFALTRGVKVLGASSMGALRASECAQFGMIPVGEIAQAYANCTRIDDADVALVHGPAEVGYAPLTEPLVDVESTLKNLAEKGFVSEKTANVLRSRAEQISFKYRTKECIFDGLPGASVLLNLYTENRISQKRLDALELIANLRETHDERLEISNTWQMQHNQLWTNALSQILINFPNI